MKQRDYGIDLLRICAAFLVVLIHLSAEHWLNYSYNSTEWFVCHFFDSIGRSAVPLFVMISGMFLLNPDKELTWNMLWHKYCKRILIIFAVWSAGYAFVFYVLWPLLQGYPAGQKAMYDSICNADVVYYIIPNYCGFPCANYYAFNERSVGYFNLDKVLLERFMSVKKRFIIVSNTEGQNFEHAMMQQAKEPEIMYLKTSKYGKKSIAGDLMESEAAKADLLTFLNA